MAKHKNYNIQKTAELDASIRQLAYLHGTDMAEWPEGFEVIYSAIIFSDWDRTREELESGEALPPLEPVFDLNCGGMLDRPSASDVGKVVREKLATRDVKFFRMLLNVVERNTPIEPLRYDLFRYKCCIAFGKKEPPVNFDDVRMALSPEVRQKVQDEATIRTAAVAVGVWPSEKAKEITPKNLYADG